jgi:hypothetical protein
VLRKKPNINWNKDRGEDVESAPWYHLFQSERINDHHLSLAEKKEAIEKKSKVMDNKSRGRNLMKIKREVMDVLEREMRMCDLAIAQINKKVDPYEKEYGYSTERFLEMFDSGELGDSHTFFKWYAYAKAKNDWQNTKLGLQDLLNSSERVDA